jgi:hypothetical protein
MRTATSTGATEKLNQAATSWEESRSATGRQEINTAPRPEITSTRPGQEEAVQLQIRNLPLVCRKTSGKSKPGTQISAGSGVARCSKNLQRAVNQNREHRSQQETEWPGAARIFNAPGVQHSRRKINRYLRKC